MSGSFGLKGKYYQTSMEIGRDLFEALKAPELEYGITECGACKMQMIHGSGKRVLHPIQLIEGRVRAGEERFSVTPTRGRAEYFQRYPDPGLLRYQDLLASTHLIGVSRGV